MSNHPPASPRARRALARLGLNASAIAGSGPNGRIVEQDVLRAAQGRPDSAPVALSATDVKASPRARRAIAQLGVDPTRIIGSGPNGRIVENDVLQASRNPATKAPSPISTSGGSRQPLSRMRKTIARRLVESKQQIPHFYVKRTLHAAALAAFHDTTRAQYPCSINDIIVKAVAMAVREFPAFRSRIEGDDQVTLEETNIGIAVGLDDGVVVPVLLNVDTLSLKELAVESKRLINLSKEKRIENMGRGVFSVSNLGMFDVDEFTAIINPPESGILAVGGIREEMVVQKGVAIPSKTLTLTLSCDHRVVDGKAAALFLKRIVEVLEAPTVHLAQVNGHASMPQIEVGRERGEFDVAVIGSGPGGYVAALEAAELGGKVVIIEKSPFVGGTCLNVGCIPSKALLASAELLHRVHTANKLGIKVSGEATPDWPAIQARKDKIIQGLRGGIGSLFKGRNVQLRQGLGSLDGRGRVVIKNGSDASVVTATSIILATGSKPSLLPSISGDRVATTDTALHWDTLPTSLLIIGGGIIGIEFACMMQAFGVTVTIVEKLPHLLAGVDAEIAEAMRQLMVRRGVTIHTDVEVREFVSNDQGCRAVLSNGTTIQAERTLVSVGRTPLTAGLGLESVDLTTDRGFLRVGDNLSATPGIFCVGDANGRTLLAHAASAQGKVAAANALGANHAFTAAIPSAIYTFPEISAVGLTEAQAKAKNLPIVIGKYPFRGHAKAMATGDTDGFVKVIRHAGGELLGVHALGHSAIEFGAAALAMINTKSSAEDLSSLVFAHPSMSEALGEAADDSYARALHLPPRKVQAVPA